MGRKVRICFYILFIGIILFLSFSIIGLLIDIPNINYPLTGITVLILFLVLLFGFIGMTIWLSKGSKKVLIYAGVCLMIGIIFLPIIPTINRYIVDSNIDKNLELKGDVYDWKTGKVINEVTEQNDDLKEIEHFEITRKWIIIFNKNYVDLDKEESALVNGLSLMYTMGGEDALKRVFKEEDWEKYGDDILRLLAEKEISKHGFMVEVDDGVFIHDDEYVSIYYLGCKIEREREFIIVFYVHNKTDAELTFQSSAIAIDGESLRFAGSEQIAAQSRGKIQFWLNFSEETLPTMQPSKISGTIRVIDFSGTIITKSYDVTFVDVKVR